MESRSVHPQASFRLETVDPRVFVAFGVGLVVATGFGLLSRSNWLAGLVTLAFGIVLPALWIWMEFTRGGRVTIDSERGHIRWRLPFGRAFRVWRFDEVQALRADRRLVFALVTFQFADARLRLRMLPGEADELVERIEATACRPPSGEEAVLVVAERKPASPHPEP